MTGIGVKGLTEKLAQLERLGKPDAFSGALLAIGEHLKGKMAEYPPENEGNQPRYPGRWYERGFGTRWQTADGLVSGEQTSETLGRKWTVTQRDSGKTVVVGNNVSYGREVHDPEEQLPVHKYHGWRTTQQVVDQERSRIQRFAEDELDRLIGQE